MNYSKHVACKLNLFNALNRYPINNSEFNKTNMRPWGAVQDKSFYFEEFEVFVSKFSEDH